MRIETEVELDIDVDDIASELDIDSLVEAKIQSLLQEYIDAEENPCSFGQVFKASITSTVDRMLKQATYV
jgi:hypothetical protein